MAWSTYRVTAGDTVSTPHGTGTVKRVSEANGSAHVDVAGQLFDVPMSDISKDTPVPQGDPSNNPMTKGEPQFKVGDKVKKIGAESQGRVTGVTPDNTSVKWNANGKTANFPTQDAGKFLINESEPKQDTPKPPETKTEEPKEDKPEVTPEQKSTADGLYGVLQLQKHLEDKIDKAVDDELKDIKEIAKKSQKLEININDKVTQLDGLKHQQLEQLISYSALRLNPLLVGMAGTGKTHAGEQVSKALDLPFYAMSVGAQTSKSDIIGYLSASGQYITTHFRKAYEEGGVFLMDEIDAGNANVLIQVNSALSNGLCAFPDKMVKRHEDFIFIASANTYGNGANRQYVGRNQLDAATLDRFAIIDWLIDDELEGSLTTGLNGKAWYMATRASRDYVAEKNIRALISPRCTQKGSKLLDIGQPLDEVIDATMLGSVPQDKRADVRQVATSIFEKFASQVKSQLSPEVNVPSVKDLIR